MIGVGVVDPLEQVVADVRRCAPAAVSALARAVPLPRAAAADAFAGTAVLVLAGLGRHARRRGAPSVRALLAKYGRPADLGAPALAVAAHLARPDLNPRLGGLLGDAASRFCSWVADRRAADPVLVGRAVAASAPLALGAAAEVAEPDAAGLLALPERCLDAPAVLDDARDPAGRAFRRLVRASAPWLARMLLPA